MKKLLIIAFLACLGACTASLRTPTALDAERGSARWAGYGVKDLTEGHRMYILKCSSCHSLFRPEAYTESAWVELFPEMATEARLQEHESDLILKYLRVMARESAPL